MENGSAEKILIESVLEKVFPVPVFSDGLDDDKEFENLRILFNYYADEEKGEEAEPEEECKEIPGGESAYQTLFNKHTGRFNKNVTLASRISKVIAPIDSNDPNSRNLYTVTANIPLSGAGTSEAILGAEKWNTVCVLPNGDRVDLQVHVLPNQTGGVSVNMSENKSSCRDNAEQGGTVMNLYLFDNTGMRSNAAKHEFGHILGFADFYIDEEPGDPPEPGFEEDVMADPYGGKIFPYHLQVLIQNY